MRANIPLGSSGPTASAVEPTALRGGEPVVIPANVQAGPSVDNLDAQTVLSQVACGEFIGSRDLPLNRQGSAMGPLTGIIPNFRVRLGNSSELAATQDGNFSLIVNALRRSRGLEAKQVSLSASERFYWATLESSFNRGEKHTLNAEKVPTAEFSKALALATGGILSTNDLTQAINSGELGHTSQQSLNTHSRLESGGLKRRTRRS